MVKPSTITLSSRVPADAKGEALIDYLARRFRYHDRAAWRLVLEAGRVHLDEVQATGAERLLPGMTLRYVKEHREPPVNTDFRVLHADDQLLVVDKPAHLPMHADGPFIRNTLIHLLRRSYGSGIQLVHRLDRETSGVVVAARSKDAQAAIQRQFGLDIEKSYLAVVDGLLQQSMVCEQEIGHHPRSAVRLRRSASPDARAPQRARTAIAPLEHGPRRTLVRCRPTTGRTHQIRVHLEHQGHPVVGDKLYGRSDEAYLAFVRRMKSGGSVFEAEDERPNRQLLHAHAITLQHPSDGRVVTFESPLPAEFRRWLLC